MNIHPFKNELFHSNTPVPLEWSNIVKDDSLLSTFYRISPLFYSVSGVYVIFLNKTLKKYDKDFWWSTMGILLILQGILSYMADVENLGKRSLWVDLDIYLATILTFIGGPIIIFRSIMGYTNYPTSFTIAWFISVSICLTCKYLSSRALDLKSVDNYIFFHGLWHCLPIHALIIIFIFLVKDNIPENLSRNL